MKHTHLDDKLLAKILRLAHTYVIVINIPNVGKCLNHTKPLKKNIEHIEKDSKSNLFKDILTNHEITNKNCKNAQIMPGI